VQGNGWPQRLEWIQISNLRGWNGQKISLPYPIMAVVGENGVGKSTVLQCAAAIYKSKPPSQSGRKREKKKPNYASDYFPETVWDKIKDAVIRFQFRQGINNPAKTGEVRKPGNRWRGNPTRPERPVVYIDLSRIQPIISRVGYSRLANAQLKEKSSVNFDETRLKRFSGIMGRDYQTAKMSYTNFDENRAVPVLGQSGHTYSGFHQGAGETVLAELIQAEIPKYSIVLIDEVESSLHPRLQRRLIRDLAEVCRLQELQIILTTHSPFVLDELPLEARVQIVQSYSNSKESRSIVYGITPEFAMSKMDDVVQHECDLYVEDRQAERMLIEILAAHCGNPDSVLRCIAIPYGAASVGQSLGIMAVQKRWERKTFIFLDGDQQPCAGCYLLPGGDAPERVVFEALRAKNWPNIAQRTGREYSKVADACLQAMSLSDHHVWISSAASALCLGGNTLWQALCAEWATGCLDSAEAKKISQPIEDALNGLGVSIPAISAKEVEEINTSDIVEVLPPMPQAIPTIPDDSGGPWLPFEQS
jgi:predicted ATPase